MSSILQRARFARDHRWTPAHVSPYIEGELSRRGRSRVLRHTAECPECRAVLASLQLMLGALARLPRAGAGEPHEIASAVRQRLRELPRD